MIDVSIQVDDKGAIRAVDLIGKQVKDMSKKLNDVGRLMIGSIHKNFDQGGRPKWPGLSPVTVAEKARKGKDRRPLIRSGNLRAHITAGVSGNKLTVGATEKYAKYHQKGMGVPARPFMLIQREDVPRIVDILTGDIGK